MPDKLPCEQFGPERAAEIEALIRASTGAVCPGRLGATCPLAPEAVAAGCCPKVRLAPAI